MARAASFFLSQGVLTAALSAVIGRRGAPAHFPQQFPVKDLEVGGVTIRGTDAVTRGHKGSRPRRILCQQPLGQRESDAFCCQERPCRQTSPQTLIR